MPVGDDQLQHLQLAQDLTRMFNRRYGVTFPTPKPMIITGGQKTKISFETCAYISFCFKMERHLK